MNSEAKMATSDGKLNIHIPRPLVLDPVAREQARAYQARADRRMHWQWLFGVLVEGFWYLAIIAAGVATGLWVVGHVR